MPEEKSETTECYHTAFSSWVGATPPDGYFQSSQDDACASCYEKNGFLVLEDAFDANSVAALQTEATRLCRMEGAELSGAGQNYSKLSEEALLAQFLCIHFPHKISALIKDQLTNPCVVDILTRIIGPNVKCMQSMLFIKAAGKPGQAWHQDELFIPTRDRSLVGAWIALDDATVENGCLWVIPGSHKPGILWPNRDHGNFEQFDCAKESFSFPYSETDEIPVEVKAGSVVFFNGYLLHRSLPNRAPEGFRRSLVNHYMSAESTLPWLKNDGYEGNWLAQQDFRDIILVAGEDPYAWKGVEDRSRAHCRKSGEGGCGDASQNLKSTQKP